MKAKILIMLLAGLIQAQVNDSIHMTVTVQVPSWRPAFYPPSFPVTLAGKMFSGLKDTTIRTTLIYDQYYTHKFSFYKLANPPIWKGNVTVTSSPGFKILSGTVTDSLTFLDRTFTFTAVDTAPPKIIIDSIRPIALKRGDSATVFYRVTDNSNRIKSRTIDLSYNQNLGPWVSIENSPLLTGLTGFGGPDSAAFEKDPTCISCYNPSWRIKKFKLDSCSRWGFPIVWSILKISITDQSGNTGFVTCSLTVADTMPTKIHMQMINPTQPAVKATAKLYSITGRRLNRESGLYIKIVGNNKFLNFCIRK